MSVEVDINNIEDARVDPSNNFSESGLEIETNQMKRSLQGCRGLQLTTRANRVGNIRIEKSSQEEHRRFFFMTP